jgi:hypothetical protein
MSTSVAVGDFNHDGRLDLATANPGYYWNASGTVSSLLGRGDGTFKAANNFETGAAPISITVGDFNRDGRLDLVNANLYGNSVSVLLGRGDGTFQAAREFAVGYDPSDVKVGDFNSDGRLDLVTSNSSWFSTVSILLNSTPTVVNTLVSFVPLPETFVTSPDLKGCPIGFVGKFRFSARLTNRSTTPRLEHLMVQVTMLTNGNLVQNAEGGPDGVGALLAVPRQEGYADEVLSLGETVKVPFVVCLRQRAPFRLMLDVVEDGGD